MLSCCFTITVMITNALCVPLQAVKQSECSPCVGRATQNQLEKPSAANDSFHMRNLADLQVPQKLKRKCCPYDFDIRLCQVINDRILCGYNRNVGKPNNDASIIVGLSDGCRIRAGRLECGYEQGPFTNIRRPPAWNNAGVPSPDDPEEYDNDDDDENAVHKGKTKRLNYLVTKKGKSKMNEGAVTKCVEINERIVCKQM